MRQHPWEDEGVPKGPSEAPKGPSAVPVAPAPLTLPLPPAGGGRGDKFVRPNYYSASTNPGGPVSKMCECRRAWPGGHGLPGCEAGREARPGNDNGG